MCRNAFIPAFLAACFLVVHPLWAQSLPETLVDWVLAERKTYAGQALYDYINGGADVYYEYGFSKVDVGYYQKNEQEIVVELYTMSNPQAALGINSFFRNHAAPPLPKPYTGKLYDFHLECLNGSTYMKLIAYDSLSVDERFSLLKELVPQPKQGLNPLPVDMLPHQRLVDSEIYFNGPISLRNFASLGRKNFFGVGDVATAYGCRIEIEGKEYKWVTVAGDSLQLGQDCERFLTYQRKNNYEIKNFPKYTLLEDQLTGNAMGLMKRGDRILFVLGLGDEEQEKILDFLTSQ